MQNSVQGTSLVGSAQKDSSLHLFRSAKNELSRWLGAVSALRIASNVVTGSGADALTVRDLLTGLGRQVQADTFQVAVLGEYSSGKSSLLNVLLRLHSPEGKKTDGLLPTAITPTTAVITTLVYDEARTIHLMLDDGRRLEVSPEQLNGFLTEASLRRKKYPWSSNAEQNEHIAKHITQVRIGCVSPFLREGIELVDTPGIGSINEDHARITKQYTAEIDAALFLVSVDPPMGEREMTFLQHIKTVTDRCLFVQTKRDLGERTEHGELVWQRREREHRRRIGEVLGRTDYPFFCVSAYQAALGLRRHDDEGFASSGFPVLETELRQFLVAERGIPRFEAWVKRSRYNLNLLKSALSTEHAQLQERLADAAVSATSDDDYAQWKLIQQALHQELVSNSREAEERLTAKNKEFSSEVMRDARRELSLTSAEQLAKSTDRRFQLERAVLRSVQYHSGDLLPPVIDLHVSKAHEALRQAFGKDMPKAFQQFLNADFGWKAPNLSVDFGGVVETKTYAKEERRGGLGFIDWLYGLRKIEVTEHNIDSTRFMATVERATEETVREVKAEMRSTLDRIKKAVNSEMDRIVQSAKDAADQQARIQKQDSSECQAQLLRNQKEYADIIQHQNDLERIGTSIRSIGVK